MVYAYALALDLADVTDLTGVRGEPLVIARLASAQAVCGAVDAAPAVDRATLVAQDALVRVLHDRSAALLPMRFGTTAAGADRLIARLSTIDGLRRRLEAVRGCEQMTIRVAGSVSRAEEPEAVFLTGTEYLQARARRLHAPPELTAIADAPGPLQRATRIDTARQPGLVGSVYHLIERGRGDEYRAAIESAVAELPSLRLLISGPSPAYAFA